MAQLSGRSANPSLACAHSGKSEILRFQSDPPQGEAPAFPQGADPKILLNALTAPYPHGPLIAAPGTAFVALGQFGS